MIFQPGTPRIGLLAAGVRNATLWLPMPDAGLPQIQWIPKGSVKELVDGSEVWQQKGWIPQLTMTWSAYDDRSTEGWTLGTANGDRPAITDLMTILSGAPASFSVSPGPAAGGFVVQSWHEGPTGVEPGGFAKGLQVTFRGGAICTSKILGTF